MDILAQFLHFLDVHNEGLAWLVVAWLFRDIFMRLFR